MTAVALWLGMDACRESKRLHARLSRVELQRPTDRELSNTGDWAYWPLTTSAEDTRIGPRF
ncbi:MAG TPA: hypothetical protein VK735_12490 [Pseudonocardia sp.]|uniref:hypothetical protein n=1 Tax=Pseudonocardia sp. TaxID=60912 RepID=UPI002B76F158|nr:hypothetical protein [Pseudonocardia sp.]HTF48259.1 hypothetical protein [Pseudonocardia sp.]